MSQPSSLEFNPYRPPETDVNVGAKAPEQPFVLAGRGARLGARLLDLVFTAGCSVPGFLAINFNRNELGFALVGLLVFAFTVYQWALVATHGQTLGKRLLHIGVVKLDGSLPGFGGGVVLRSWVVSLMYLVPLLNLVVGVGILLIFGRQRRCLHDLIAGTRVVALDALPPAGATQ